MANFPLICTVETCTSFTPWQHYSCSGTQGRSKDPACVQGSYLHEAPFDFTCSFIISSLYRIKFISSPPPPGGLFVSSSIYFKNASLISMYIAAWCKEKRFFLWIYLIHRCYFNWSPMQLSLTGNLDGSGELAATFRAFPGQ